ncbi:phosphatidate cytidylyltransferase [Thermincola ferriacetica]|uniref:Phosphatidate cytidylyltransferase n=1 Tax=Thermincola ferriacetica TaxID=281456 RepID=A0A0L6W6N2_9FIRM|nr:phosphatidate cytidylyltransferase [Thermincola ferriacetica]KNZ71237.1 phosphatidate cytidylyltransferase [Thermincola ferriacetica]
MLLYRVLSAVIGIPILLFSVWLGGWYLAAVITVLAVIGVLEFARIAEGMQVKVWVPGMLIGVILFILSVLFPKKIKLALVVTIIIWVFLCRTVIGTRFNILNGALSLTGTIYLGWLLSHILLLRALEFGFYLVLFVFMATWFTDTMAYFVGSGIGRHKLAPTISPKKTIEGAVGGLIGSTLAGLLMSFFLKEVPMIHLLVIGFLAGIVGQAGDLVESAMKRKAGVKDSGNLIPGHGGVLDRFDSMLFTAPLVYYYVQLFIIN